MFPSRLLRGIDLAIEFATLGEYGLEPVPGPAAPRPAFRVDLSGIGGSAAVPGAAASLGPATPAARRLAEQRSAQAAPRPSLSKAPLCTPLPSRRALRAGTARPPHTAAVARKRKRAGAAVSRPQPCLVADGRRPQSR
jgi:hypothetical protein